MDHYLFVEFKHGRVEIEPILNSGANKLMIAAYSDDPDPKLVQQARAAGIKIGLCSGTYQADCAADPKVNNQIKTKVNHLISLNPDEIWLDHVRFHGRWETSRKKLFEPHQPCKFCRGKDRKNLITNYFQEINQLIPKQISFGFFAVPFMSSELPDYPEILGLDYRQIQPHTDMISPMLYHRMLNKPPSYIHEYVNYLYGLGHQYIVPIIQVKDMPDDLPDKYTPDEMQTAYQKAIEPPSKGVSFFSWDHAIEKNKTKVIIDLITS